MDSIITIMSLRWRYKHMRRQLPLLWLYNVLIIKVQWGATPPAFVKKKTAFNLLWTPSPVLLSLGWQEHRNNLFRREQGASWDKPTKEERRSLGVLHCMSGLLTRWPRFADAKAWTKYQRIDRAKADVREQITGGEARLWLECNEMDCDAAPSVGICLAPGVGLGNI